ncbi:SAM-dependent methyltransferase [Silvimonas iriomotensis]|uniref:Cyclopropane-fatty-acyl-phospholipid synthase n=1 Tax=Silvimonas iriomotensis TaxID=449662 RepID=A0ABQ2P8T7_9NEIS|nr:cyclopropane-fatty-acyl-phospholipid synthase family protein [Silvimonas iriomotensis]GGP21162.1 cyclopropane-fatty-acyl-phospholipid synthase [Silvimonas iriomotensis]
MSSIGTLAIKAPAPPLLARMFMQLLRRISEGCLTVTLPGHTRMMFGNANTALLAELHIHDWRACGRILAAGDIGFADALQKGWVSSPDLTALIRLAIRNESVMARTVRGTGLVRFWYALRHLARPNTRRGSQRNIHAHYDIGNPFYMLWLDESWSYSSALFAGDFSRSLADAQAAKYQRVIDQLGLKPGMQVLEIGCGWGGFAEHAARLGIHVHGVTISAAQYEIAQQRLQRQNLQHLARVELRDYRDIRGQYDALVSIEMFEAVGQTFWSLWFDTVRGLLKPGARALVQSITIDEQRFEAYRSSSDFIREYIFPGGMLPSPERFSAAASQARFQVLNVLHFGPDYAETLRRWRDAFNAHLHEVRQQGFDETFIRTWLLYLCYCEAGFDEGRTDVVQFMLQRPV